MSTSSTSSGLIPGARRLSEGRHTAETQFFLVFLSGDYRFQKFAVLCNEGICYYVIYFPAAGNRQRVSDNAQTLWD
jgi:hypothetical protein